MRVLLLLCIAMAMHALDLSRILMLESSSYYNKDGSIEWINRARGVAGERGCFQMTHSAWLRVRLPGESFNMLDDTAYAETCAKRYIARWPKLRNWNPSSEYKRRYDALATR